MKAAVLREIGKPLEIENVQINKPKAHEVLIRTAAAGVCHSDLHFIEGLYRYPMPVVTEHPIRAARSSGMSLLIATQAFSWISICSAKEERLRNWKTGVPSLAMRGSSSPARFVSGLWQRDMWPVRQCSQRPQNAERHVMT